MLMPVKIDLNIKENDCKYDAIRANAISYNKITITLWIKMVIFYMGLTIVKVEEPSF